MKILIIAVAILTTAAYAAAEDHGHHHDIAAPASSGPGWITKAKADYPLKTCVVSGEELGGNMGGAIDYVYHKEGQPDRLVRFCCKRCVAKFEKDPEKYLKTIDEASRARKD